MKAGEVEQKASQFLARFELKLAASLRDLAAKLRDAPTLPRDMVALSLPPGALRLRPAVPRAPRVRCWSGESVASVEIAGVPIETLYNEYADLSRMTEWSPLLESVTVDPSSPTQSVWVMRVPRPLKVATRALGYPDVLIEWEATLAAPGPPTMSWSSRLDGAPGEQNAGFVPSGECSFVPAAGGGRSSVMTLTLRYTIPEPAEKWKVALVDNPVTQGIVRGRMVAGMRRFAAAVTRESDAAGSASNGNT